MLRGLLLLAVALLAAAPQEPMKAPETISGKPLHKLLEEWPDQYVKWIITSSERNTYKALETDEQKLAFIEFFWARRDPDPKTPVNEYRKEYLERYAFVMNHLSAGKPGWATDRGRLYLILGPPHAIQQNPTGRTNMERPSEIWTYNNLDIPGFPASIDFQFVDFKGTGDFEIVQDIDQTAPIWNQFGTVDNALDAIAQRRQRIGEVDQEGIDRFKNVDDTRLVMNEFDLEARLKDVYEKPSRDLPPLRTEVATRAAFGELPVTAAGGAVWGDGDQARVPVQLTVPYKNLAYRAEGATLFYDVDYVVMAAKEDGEEVARTEDELTLSIGPDEQEKLGDVRLSISAVLQTPPGDYKLVAYIRDRNRNHIGHVEQQLRVPPKPSGSLALSSIFLASEILPADLSQSKAFQFGAIRVIPAAERVFGEDESLKLYVEAYGASAGADGRKRLRVDFFVMRDGRLALGVPASYVRPEAEPVGITGEIPLRKCSPGDYVLRVRVTDEPSGTQAESEVPFTVR